MITFFYRGLVVLTLFFVLSISFHETFAQNPVMNANLLNKVLSGQIDINTLSA